MPRPRKCRRVCKLPAAAKFFSESKSEGCHTMSVEEYETVRLLDSEGLTQQECAQRMSVARPTVQRIYDSARKKLAFFLVEGGSLIIEGGDYRLCGESEKPCCKCGCPHR